MNVFRYSYLSGLDGEVPGDDSVKAGRGEKPKTTETAKDAQAGAKQERPEGTGQLDYVRALAARIQDEGEGAKAIGILGTDPYDAVLIIKALRPAFPYAVFFTVDLAYFTANLTKVPDGGWFPLVVAAAIFTAVGIDEVLRSTRSPLAMRLFDVPLQAAIGSRSAKPPPRSVSRPALPSR